MYEYLLTEKLLERLERYAAYERTPTLLVLLRDQIEERLQQLSREQAERLAAVDAQLATRPRLPKPILHDPPTPTPWWWYLEVHGEEGDGAD